ncbi:MAG: hypothetical protein JM58_08670 [Peptococcaceae bacterium BICA1-8]|nr:MAG: hypothetical protein JM58_08670 [Peptococcaceae bacterium BICA1-8]
MMDTKKVLTICGILSVILLLLDIIFVEPHGHYFWQTFKGFDVIYGFVGCAAIIVISKKLGKLFIQRDEKYYGGGVDTDE